jgi:hypothetical protein
MRPLTKKQIKQVLGGVPFAAELYWQLRQPGKPITKSFSLRRLQKALPEWSTQAQAANQRSLTALPDQKRVFLFATMRQWIQQTTLLGLTLSGLGHQPTLAFLPYADWRNPLNRFDLRRQNLYTKRILQNAQPLLTVVSFSENGAVSAPNLPEDLREAIQQVSIRDVQYTLQIEDFDSEDDRGVAAQLLKLRLQRNTHAAQMALPWLRSNQTDLVLVPNGSILEFGAVYQVARYLKIPVVTYEFGEQRQRIWIAQNDEVMHQDTSAMWDSFATKPLDPAQWETIKDLYAARRQANLWENFSRRWQGLPRQGGQQVRGELGLDERPVVLLAANVIGDSLTLGRQVFSQSMTEWLERTTHYFAGRQDVQLIVRTHPGERYTNGPSVSDLLKISLPELPENINIISADAPVNTYDLVELASLGLVYTTTVGMEMAMSGVPVIVAGQTHYRQKGFTIDPSDWNEYFTYLDQALNPDNHYRMSKEQVERAWNYAYRFFFNYPMPYPWHLHFFLLKELQTWPLERVLSEEGQTLFGNTFRTLLGESRDYSVEHTIQS